MSKEIFAGKFKDLTGDTADSIKSAIFQIETEVNPIQESFVSFPKPSKNYFSKFGTNFRFFINSKLKPFTDSSDFSSLFLLGSHYFSYEYWIFKQDFSEIIWVTYRENFRGFDSNKNLNSDVGWGCTIRVGQMLLLSVLKKHARRSDWSLIWKIQENLLNAPYSIHKIMEIGEAYDKRPGDWYSPSSIGFILTELLRIAPEPGLKSLIFMNGVIYKDQVFAEALEIPQDSIFSICECIPDEYLDLGSNCSSCGKKIVPDLNWKNAIFLQVSLMLGIGKVLPEYYEFLKFILSLKQNVGIVGGKPRMALFIVGYADNNLIVMDPHLVQDSIKSETEFKARIGSYYCKNPMTVGFDKIESSLNIGFYFKDKSEWDSFERAVNENTEIIKGVFIINERESENLNDIIEVDFNL